MPTRSALFGMLLGVSIGLAGVASLFRSAYISQPPDRDRSAHTKPARSSQVRFSPSFDRRTALASQPDPSSKRTTAPNKIDAAPTLTVSVHLDRHLISPYIYGMSFAPAGLAEELALPVNRWGGNATTRYNWRLDTANRASDWFFENIPEENDAPEALPDGSKAHRFVAQNQRLGVQTVLTLPMIGWTPHSRAIACGFRVDKYGPQTETDPWRQACGNGVDLGGRFIRGNDSRDTSIAVGPDFGGAWIDHLVDRFGSAAAGGVMAYSLDNEPMLWHITHRDVRPEPLGAEEFFARSITYASMVKATDPSAATLGPGLWGWDAYFSAAADQSNRFQSGANLLESAVGKQPLAARYLAEMQSYETAHDVRILDYFDLHFYPQAPGVALAPAGDSATQALRLRSLRALWDPTYIDESWIGQPVQLIPRMRTWVREHYPGTKLALSEYNWGGLEHINGALAQADALGIFGREALDMAMLWGALAADQPYAFAFRMYRNYDGNGNMFGDISLDTASSDAERVSIYAAKRSSDGALTIMIINKSGENVTSNLAIEGDRSYGPLTSYVYSEDALDAIIPGPVVAWARSDLTITLPQQSITLLVGSKRKPASNQRPAQDRSVPSR